MAAEMGEAKYGPSNLTVQLSYEEKIINALARLPRPRSDNVIQRNTREFDAIRGVLAPLYAELAEAQAEVERLRDAIPSHLRGDGPCQDCGSLNIVWFTDNVVWNAVMEAEKRVFASDRPETGILCPFCFVKRAEAAGLRPTGWRLTPEWPWRTLADAATPETEQAP